MSKIAHSPRTRSHTFSVFAPWGNEAFLAGSFNGWNPRATPMKRDGDGEWSTIVELKPGRHEYKFVIDGQWYCETGCAAPCHACPKCTPNDLGTKNQVVDIT